MSDRQRAVMRRRLGEPAGQVAVGMLAESDRRLGVADLHNRPIGCLAFAADQLELAVAGLREVERGHRPWADLRLDRYPRALLAVIQAQAAQDRSARRNST